MRTDWLCLAGAAVLHLHCAAATPLTVEGDGPAFPCDPATYSDPALYGEDGLPSWRPLILGHRGAPGMFPEHTARGYREAARQGADIIECDLAITKDHQFVCLHEPWLSGTTDVASHPEFADRKMTFNMDDDDPEVNWNDKGDITDWFSFNFTLAELKTLKKRQSADYRDPRYDYQEDQDLRVVGFDELVDITRDFGAKQKRVIGIYPELKHSFAINKILGGEKRFEDLALEKLRELGFSKSTDPCYLQSFEMTSLEYVRPKTELKLVFLLEQNITQQHWDRLDRLRLAGIGVDKGNLVTPGCKDPIGRGSYECGTTDFIGEVHRHGLKAHGFTFRNEWQKLYWDHGQDPYSQLEEFYDLQIDGYFSDFPLTIRRFLHYKGVLCGPTTSLLQKSQKLGSPSSSNCLSSIRILAFVVVYLAKSLI